MLFYCYININGYFYVSKTYYADGSSDFVA